jgi:hypothetical protein
MYSTFGNKFQFSGTKVVGGEACENEDFVGAANC